MATFLTPGGFDVSYLNTWEYIFFPERFEQQEIIRRYGYQPGHPKYVEERTREIARAYIPVPNAPMNDSASKRDP